MRVLCSGKVKDNKKSTRFRKKSSTFFVYARHEHCLTGASPE